MNKPRTELDIKVKKLCRHAQIPEYASDGSVGLDLVASDHYRDNDKNYHEYGTGLALELPQGYEAQIRPRSSISSQVDLILINSPGTIDSDYRGEIMVRFKELKDNPRIYEVGQKIAQMVIMPVPRVKLVETRDDLVETVRGNGGFGSTGK